ncbi:hypothetical protein K2Y00_01700 [Patescibacteria group bacterium]|nr:hypothetical protein [Patescibacteria group bacterium]
MIQKLPFALIGLLILLLGFFLYTEHKAPVPGEGLMVYEGTNYTFSYPDGYVVTPTPEGVSMVRSDDTVAPIAGEGPTGITITMHPLNEGETLTQWLENGASNYELGAETHTSALVNSMEAVRYSWSGLYEGDTTAFIQGNQVVAISRTWLSRGDHTHAYETVLRTYARQ